MMTAFMCSVMTVASCDDEEDNPVVPTTHTVRINEFKITGPSTADIGQVLVFGVDKKAWCLVTIDAEVYSITGTQADIPETVRPYIDVIWTSSNPQVATVDANGTVTAIAPGQTTIQITVKAKDGSISKSASYSLTVKEPAPEPTPEPTPEVVVKPAAISYATTSISKTYGDANFTNPLTNTGDGTVTYESSNTAVAEVNATTGEVTITGDGEATIKATVTDTENYTYESKIVTYTLGVGTATMTVTASGYSGTYDGSAHGITVTVASPDGVTVKYGTTEGSYDLTASPSYTDAGTYTVYYEATKNGYTTVTGSATVTINKAAGSISFASANYEKKLGDAAFTNALTNTGDGTVTYQSSDTAVAEVSANGEVTIKGKGSATITATVADGTNYTYATKTATYTLSVSDTTDGSGSIYDNDDYTVGGNPF